MTARLVLPPPISTNNLFATIPAKGRGGTRRITTRDYKAWRGRAEEYLGAQAPLPRFGQPVELTYFVGETGVGNMDWGNTEKALTDALVGAGIIRDDSRKWVRSGHIFWTPGMAGVVVLIEAAGPDPDGAEIAQAVKPGLRELLR